MGVVEIGDKWACPQVLSGLGFKSTSSALCYNGVQQNGKDQVKVNYSPALFTASKP